jgi:hypothetical protein
MDTSALCQALLDHLARQLPEEHDALLGLAALATFHPEESRLFITDVMLVLMRNDCPLPPHLAREVSARLGGPAVTPVPAVVGETLEDH